MRIVSFAGFINENKINCNKNIFTPYSNNKSILKYLAFNILLNKLQLNKL